MFTLFDNVVPNTRSLFKGAHKVAQVVTRSNGEVTAYLIETDNGQEIKTGPELSVNATRKMDDDTAAIYIATTLGLVK